MPQVGVSCVRGKALHADCRACSMNPLHPCEYPPDMLESMRCEDPERTEFTPSSLLECDRRSALKSGNAYFVDVDAAMRMQRGTIFHAGIDATARYPVGSVVEVIREIRLKTMVDTKYGPQLFSGKADVVVVKEVKEGVAYCKVVDYKTKGGIKHDLTSADRMHQMQVNMYGWLVERCLVEYLIDQYYNVSPLGNVEEVIVDELEIVYIDMKKVRRFTSVGPLQTKGKQLSRSEKTYETLELEPIKHLPSEITGNWIAKRIEEKIDARTELPPILEGDQAWVCTYCAIKEKCYEIG